MAGNSVWLPEFTPKECNEKSVIKQLLQYLYIQNVCCVVIGGFPLYLAGKLPTFNTVNLFIINRVKHTTKLKCFLFGTRSVIHINNLKCELIRKSVYKIFYKVSNESISVRVSVQNVFHRVGQEYNKYMSLNFMHFLWKVLPYKAVCYGIFALPPTGQICYTHLFDAECGWGNRNPRVPERNVVNARSLKLLCDTHHTSNKCGLCAKNPPSLKAIASNTIYQYIYNVKEFEMINSITYSNYKIVSTHPQVMLHQLVPFDPPFNLVTHYVAFIPINATRYHKQNLYSKRVCRYSGEVQKSLLVWGVSETTIWHIKACPQIIHGRVVTA